MAASTSRGRTRLRDDDREVALDGRLSGRGGDAVRRRLPAGQPGDRELPDDDPVGAQVERVDEQRMELAEAPDDGPARDDARRPAGMEVRIVGDRA